MVEDRETPERKDQPRPVIRDAAPTDAIALLELKSQLDRETTFMLLEADERTESPGQLARELRAVSKGSNSVVLLAFMEGRLVGYAQAMGGRYRRNQATAEVVIGVLSHVAGRGVGSILMDHLARRASTGGVHRLELTVQAHNEHAIRLYLHKGFSIEGRRRECLFVNGEAIDELYMARLIADTGRTS